EARLQLTVRNTNAATRALLLDGIARIAENLGRAAGLPEELLPEVIVLDEWTPPMVNDADLVRRLKGAWSEQIGAGVVVDEPPTGMGGEDFPFFAIDPEIPSAFWRIGGTSAEDIAAAKNGGAPVPSHHSPEFRVEPDPSIMLGVE